MRAVLGLVAILLGITAPAIAQIPPPPGKMVAVGGYKLHVNCTGVGSPTVILEAGASSFSINWALVQPAVSRTNRVCSYDRAGYVWSEPGPYDLRGADAVMGLRAALAALGETPPFVLVGQSMGGRFVRLFALAHATDVVGMVLVDAEHEDGLRQRFGREPVLCKDRHALHAAGRAARRGVDHMMKALAVDFEAALVVARGRDRHVFERQ